MSQVLYITANPKAREKSTCLSLGEEFLKAYREAKPADEIIVIDLYNTDIPEIDYDLLNVIENLKMGIALDNLSEQTHRKIRTLQSVNKPVCRS